MTMRTLGRLASAMALLGSAQAYAIPFEALLTRGSNFLQEQTGLETALTGRVNGTAVICAANELKTWIESTIVPEMKNKYPKAEFKLVFDGSGEIGDRLNANNADRCDLVVMASTTSSVRWSGFKAVGASNVRAVDVAYTPTMWVGRKDKLDAARVKLGKAPGSAFTCQELGQIAELRRYSRVKQDSPGNVRVELSTSNSGMTQYMSCAYSLFDVTTPEDLENELKKTSAADKEDVLRRFMTVIKFDVPSTGDVTKSFVENANELGQDHLAIATYESYLLRILPAAKARNLEIEYWPNSVSVLNNFPAQIIAARDSQAGRVAQATVSTMLGESAQRKLIDSGLRPASAKIANEMRTDARVKDIFKFGIEVGDAPTTAAGFRRVWESVRDIPGVISAGILKF